LLFYCNYGKVREAGSNSKNIKILFKKKVFTGRIKENPQVGNEKQAQTKPVKAVLLPILLLPIKRTNKNR